MLDIKDKKVTILGGQRSGIATAILVKEKGGIPRLSDVTQRDAFDPDLLQEIEKVCESYEFGGHTDSFIQESDLIILSPGVSVYANEVLEAKKNGIPVLGEIEFAYQYCSAPIIAVTGSNGKTTVVTLIDKLLRGAGLMSCLCGNIGTPFSSRVQMTDGIDYYVLEVSSFQMESILSPEENQTDILSNFKGFKPYIAVLLNINQNHLDRHQDLNEYILAKKRIFINQDEGDYAILNKNRTYLEKIEEEIQSKIIYFEDDENEDEWNVNQRVVLTVAQILDIDPNIGKKVFDEFDGVEHRLELIKNIKGVDYINDSKATTAESCIWALDHIDKPVVMICGGRDKNIDYHVVKDKVAGKVKKMIVIGEAKEKISQTFRDLVTVEICDFLDQAVIKAKDSAQEGDCVLFSPMCASFDMFKNFEERGNAFKELVQDLDKA